jgi:hypothetical protein
MAVTSSGVAAGHGRHAIVAALADLVHHALGRDHDRRVLVGGADDAAPRGRKLQEHVRVLLVDLGSVLAGMGWMRSVMVSSLWTSLGGSPLLEFMSGAIAFGVPSPGMLGNAPPGMLKP